VGSSRRGLRGVWRCGRQRSQSCGVRACVRAWVYATALRGSHTYGHTRVCVLIKAVSTCSRHAGAVRFLASVAVGVMPCGRVVASYDVNGRAHQGGGADVCSLAAATMRVAVPARGHVVDSAARHSGQVLLSECCAGVSLISRRSARASTCACACMRLRIWRNETAQAGRDRVALAEVE